MDIYRIIRLYQHVRSPRLKLLGLLVLHLTRRRYLNLAFDPALGCNLQCRMCYFSDPERRKTLHGTFTEADLQAIARSLFHRVLRLQIGCGAEPTIFRQLPQLIALAKEHGIPHVSLTTNGQLLTADKLQMLADNGLDEVILSTHGLTSAVYEDLMQGARFQRFQKLLADIRHVKDNGHPQLKLRINYTMNADNIDDLQYFQEVFAQTRPDTIQLRPIQNIGNSSYSNFSTEALLTKYDERIKPLVDHCRQQGITCLYPQRENLLAIDTHDQPASHINSIVAMLPYFQLSPFEGWREKIDPYNETFEDYSRRTHRTRYMLRQLFSCRPAANTDDAYREDVTKALNYNVR